jgi:hypothetical protein
LGLQNELPVEAAFDVLVRLPSGLRLDEVSKRGQAAGIKPERLQALVDALRNVPQVQIGKAVSRERADAAKALYEKAGLAIDITPVLAIEAKGTTEEVACPSCRERVILTATRQCPRCNVFVDKFTDDYLAKRRQAELDRAALKRELENEFQAKLDAALVEKLKKHGVFKGRAGAGRAVALLVLLGAAFVVGRGTLAGWNVDALMASGGSQSRSDRMMETAWKNAPAAAGAPGAPGAGGAAAGAPGAAEAAAGPMDPDLDDPLIQQAGGKRIGAKGISIEQAVAASRVLARTVGNAVADRAIDGAGGKATAAGEVPAGAATAGAAPGAAAGGAASGKAAAAVPATLKVSLGLELARQLAAMGQPGRATQIMKALGSRAQSEPALAAEAQAAAIETRAWAIGGLDAAQARSTAQALLAEADKISDPAARVRALTQAAAALSQQPQLPREAARGFIARAGETLPSVAAEAREQAMAGWAAGLGTVMLHESTTAARAGRWSVVRANSAQLQTLAQQAPAGAQARLLAMAYQLQTLAGDSAGAGKSLDTALALAAAEPNLAQRAALLRAIAAGAGSVSDKLGAAVDALQGQLQGRSGAESAQGLLELSLLHAESGFRAKAAETADAARRVQGLAPADAVRLHTELVVRSDLVAARVLQGVGLFAEAEALVQKVGAYLL